MENPEAGISGRPAARGTAAAFPGHDSKHDLPERNLTPTGPNQVRSSDITYLWTGGDRLYPAITPDPFNREVVGWSPKPRMTADIVTDALTMAWFRRKPAAIDPSFGSGSPI
jgi:transposase InsO family protein